MVPLMQHLQLNAGKLIGNSRRKKREILGLFFLCVLIYLEFAPFNISSASAQALPTHTSPTANYACSQVSFSRDGNPFPLCPASSVSGGGNCTWWAWEQWHALGYDLPLNWGNAADWVVDAEHAGLPLGTTPRLGSIAVFPRADGVWAFGPEGHVAFVTAVSSDATSFNVTYQNYGDPHYMYTGTNYNVAAINQPRFQNGLLRFIYFPRNLDVTLLARLPGIVASGLAGIVDNTNSSLAGTSGTTSTSASTSPSTPDRVALGLASASSDQEFNADFSGEGASDLLLYNRGHGNLAVFRLTQPSSSTKNAAPTADKSAAIPQRVDLGDATTPVGHWGSSLDVHIGNFAGTAESDILLYDRVAGTIQILSLNPDMSIKKHVTLSDVGTDWELYVGRLSEQRSGLFMYKRYAQSDPIISPPNPIQVQPPAPVHSQSTSTPTSTPTATPSPTVVPTATATATASPTAAASPTPTSTATVTPAPTATATATPTPTSVPTVVPTPAPTATPKPTPAPTATATPKPTPAPTPAPTPTPTHVPTPTPTPTQTAAPKATATPTKQSTSNQSATLSAASTEQQAADLNFTQPAAPAPTPGNTDLSGSSLSAWEQQGRTANVLLLDFNQDFSIRNRQQYTLWHGGWEVYVGRFVSADQDSIFLYDRIAGEGRLMDFDTHLQLADYQKIHQLTGNWTIYTGDFAGSGRAQMLLYDPSSGAAQILTFAQNLALVSQKSLTNLNAHQVLYVGHFGMPTLSIMLYDPQKAQSTFIALDPSLAIVQQRVVKTWDQHWQILIGAFVDHSRCSTNTSCAQSDDILVLNRQNGQIEQYIFSFGTKFQVYDNRIQAFIRLGVYSTQHVTWVDTTTFNMVSTLSTSIRDEELY